MIENKKKFKIPIVWHNCYNCPPTEPYNSRLLATNGNFVFSVEYDVINGWYDKDRECYLPFDLLYDYWWADVEQTVRECSEFKGG